MYFGTGRSGASILLGAAALLAAGALHGAGPAMPPPAVRTEKVSMIDRSEPKSYVAGTAPYALVEIVARVSGTMTKDPGWKEGGEVKEGQLLYEIEDTVYKANVLSAEANINSAKASIEQINAELVFAQKEYDRHKKLLASKATSQTSYESSLRTLNTCKARLTAAEGSLKAAEAALILAKNDLTYTKIFSPVRGRIGRSVYSSGNYITPAKGALATVVQYDPIKLQLAMSEADYLHYKKNRSRLELQIFGADRQEIKQKVKLDFVDNRADTNTGTIMVQFLVPNRDGMLIPEGYATVKVSEKFAKPLAGISVSALMTDGRQHFVYVVKPDNSVERRAVKAGPQVGSRQLILDGLAEGEQVIVNGIHKVRPGQPVNPIPESK